MDQAFNSDQDLVIRISRSEKTIRHAARQALRKKLHEHKWWMFYEVLHNPESIIRMATAFIGSNRIGVSILWDYRKLANYDLHYDLQIGCYILPEFRRQGIGTMLVKRMNVGDDVRYGRGIQGSLDFWRSIWPGDDDEERED